MTVDIHPLDVRSSKSKTYYAIVFIQAPSSFWKVFDGFEIGDYLYTDGSDDSLHIKRCDVERLECPRIRGYIQFTEKDIRRLQELAHDEALDEEMSEAIQRVYESIEGHVIGKF